MRGQPLLLGVSWKIFYRLIFDALHVLAKYWLEERYSWSNLKFRKNCQKNLTSTFSVPGELQGWWLLVKSKTSKQIYHNHSILHINFKSLTITVFEEMREQYHVPKYTKKGDNSEAEVNFQTGSKMQRDIHLRHHPCKNH